MYKALDTVTKQIVALKQIPLGEDGIDAVYKEMKTMKMVNHHDNVIKYYGYFNDDESLWIVMVCCSWN